MIDLDKTIQSKKQRAILFADISGSSALYKNIGNDQAKTIVDELLESLRKTVLVHHGVLIKTIGDEVMTSFESCDECLRAAVEMQDNFVKVFEEYEIQLSIGMSFGEVLVENSDVFGEVVNDAAYLTKVAKGGQILITDSVYTQLGTLLAGMVKIFDLVKLKGAVNKSTIYRVYWQGEESSHCETRFISAKEVNLQLKSHRLTVKYQDETFHITQDHTPFIIGRDAANCHLLVEGNQVSREHCHIDFRRGKFVLIDLSTNGCFISSLGKHEFYIRREEYPLIDATQLSLGVSVDQDDSAVISIY